MKKYFISVLKDWRYIIIFILGCLIVYYSNELIYNLILDFFTENIASFTLSDIFKSIIFPISLKNIEILFLAIAREVIIFLTIFYPIVKIIDLFLTYISSILFTKISRTEWVLQISIFIIFYSFWAYFILYCIDIMALYNFSSNIISIKELIEIFLIKYLIILISINFYLFLAIKMTDNAFSAILSVILFLLISIIINNIFLEFSLCFIVVFTLLSILILWILFLNSNYSIKIRDLGGV